MIRKYAEIFCWKNVSSFCTAKATHIFSAKNIRILYIELAKTVNEMTLNELVKLTTLWTTGPWYPLLSRPMIYVNIVLISPRKHMLWILINQKISIFFYFSQQTCFGYSKVPCWGASYEYHSIIFWRNKKNINTLQLKIAPYPELCRRHLHEMSSLILWNNI